MLARAEAQRVYVAVRKSHERTTNTLQHSTYSHKCWEKLKGSIFGVKPTIHDLRGPRGGLVVAPAEKASLLGSQFDSKQCREQFFTPLFCFPQPRCNSLASWCCQWGIDPLDAFPLFLKKVAGIIAPKLSIIFRRLMRLGSFPECWRSANVTVIAKGAPSPDTENYRAISITPILSKVYEKLVLTRSPNF